MANKGLLSMDLSRSASQVAGKWRKWKRAFEYYAEGKGIDNARSRRKTSQLLHFAGMEVQYILEYCKILVPSLRQVTMLLKSRFAN